jgi:hypothetical protein
MVFSIDYEYLVLKVCLDERRLVVATVPKYQGYSIDCLKKLQDVCSIPIKDMQHLRVCIECAKDHAEQLDRDVPDADTIVVAKSNPDLIVAAQGLLCMGLIHFS